MVSFNLLESTFYLRYLVFYIILFFLSIPYFFGAYCTIPNLYRAEYLMCSQTSLPKLAFYLKRSVHSMGLLNGVA